MYALSEPVCVRIDASCQDGHTLLILQCVHLQASESRSMRGMKRMASDAAARFKQQQAANGQGQFGTDDTAHGVNPVTGNGTTGIATRNGV